MNSKRFLVSALVVGITAGSALAQEADTTTLDAAADSTVIGPATGSAGTVEADTTMNTPDNATESDVPNASSSTVGTREDTQINVPTEKNPNISTAGMPGTGSTDVGETEAGGSTQSASDPETDSRQP